MDKPDRLIESPRDDSREKRPWTKPRIKKLRVFSTRGGTQAGWDEDFASWDNFPDNKYAPIS